MTDPARESAAKSAIIVLLCLLVGFWIIIYAASKDGGWRGYEITFDPSWPEGVEVPACDPCETPVAPADEWCLWTFEECECPEGEVASWGSRGRAQRAVCIPDVEVPLPPAQACPEGEELSWVGQTNDGKSTGMHERRTCVVSPPDWSLKSTYFRLHDGDREFVLRSTTVRPEGRTESETGVYWIYELGPPE